MSQMNETQLMQENLQRMIRNENYFSCLFQKNHEQEQPVNPFRKRMFDKNLRRSTVSCGHYNSTSNHNHSRNQETNNESPKIKINSLQIVNNNRNIIKSQLIMMNQLSQSPLMIQKTQKITLAQSRQSNNPHKQKITKIINNFRLQLDYLQQKLHSKVDTIQQKYHNNNDNDQCKQNQQEINFMIQSLQKIIGFMIENCVNLQDAVIYGQQQNDDGNNDKGMGNQYDKQQGVNNHNNGMPLMMKREIYQIYDNEDNNDDQNQDQEDRCKQQQQQQEQRENISFGQIQQNYSYNQLSGNNNNMRHMKEKSQKRVSNNNNKNNNRIIGLIDKQNNSQQNIHNNINMPNTFFINDKLHLSNEKPNNNKNNFHLKNKIQKDNTRSRRCDDTQKQSNRINQQQQNQSISSKPNNRRTPSTSNHHNDYHYHSHKENNSYSHHNNYNYSSCPIENQQQPIKSIYETVLQERQMRIKMKKRMV